MRKLVFRAIALSCSVVGLSSAMSERARAEIVNRPNGAAARWAVAFLAEVDGRRLDQDGAAAIDLLPPIEDLVWRPQKGAKVVAAAYDSPAPKAPPAAVKTKPVVNKAEVRRNTEQIMNLTQRFRSESNRCDPGSPFPQLTTCIADALDNYAKGLEKIESSKPEVAAVAAPVIRRAANRVRAAKRPEQARAAIAEARAAVRKSISLARADDPVVQRLLSSQRTVVDEGLATADVKLVRAIGI